MATALRYKQRRRHLSLVDNIQDGEPIVAAARKKNDALLVAEELGIDLAPELVEVPRRRTRKPRVNRNGPVEKTVAWASVSREAKLHALMMAGGDILRCKPIDRDTVVVLNNPQRKPPR